MRHLPENIHVKRVRQEEFYNQNQVLETVCHCKDNH